MLYEISCKCFRLKPVFPRYCLFQIHLKESLLSFFRPTGRVLRDMATRFQFLTPNYRHKGVSPKLDFHSFSVHRSDSERKRTQMQNPYTGLSLKHFFTESTVTICSFFNQSGSELNEPQILVFSIEKPGKMLFPENLISIGSWPSHPSAPLPLLCWRK